MIQMETPAVARGGKGRFQNNDHGDVQRQPATCNPPEDRHRDYVLAWLRCLSGRVRMFCNEIDRIGISLKSGFETPDSALQRLHELDPILLRLIEAGKGGA
jgi:hypothetical protein